MPRRVANPPNPWTRVQVEWLGEPPEARVEVYEERARSILARNDSPDVPFTWSVNPYRGCQHACAYCYARPGHELLGFGAGTDFDTKIVVKTNAAELLSMELARSRLEGEWIAFSGVTDPYQPLEAAYGLTRACLEVCLARSVPVGIVTKGALVRRDVDLLARLHERAGAEVHVSIPFLDADRARAVEPWAPAPRLRLDAVRCLAEAGLPVGVAVAPVIPGLNDEEIPRVLEAAAAAGATRAFLILLRLTAPVRAVFEERLRAALPDRAERVLHALDDARSGQTRAERGDFGTRFVGAGPRWEAIRSLYAVTCRRLGLATGSGGPLEDLGPRQPRGRQGLLFGKGGSGPEERPRE